MSRTLAPALLIGLLATAAPAGAQERAGPAPPDRFAAARLVSTPAQDVAAAGALAPAATPSAAPTPSAAAAPPGLAAVPARPPRTGTLTLGILGGAAAGATLGCVIGDCGGDFLHPPDDALVGGLLGAVIGLVIALWVEPDDDWRPPRLPPRPR